MDTNSAAPRLAPLRLEPPSLDPGTDIGHVHLKVADLDRALAFYRDVLGFELTSRLGDQAAFLSAGGYHHHIGLNTWESRGGSPPPRHATGLYHVAIRYPTRAALARALRALLERSYPLEGASDHAVSEAIYLRDPDGNGIELYWDRPREAWPKLDGGGYAMTVNPLDLDDLLAAADADAGESTAEAADRDQARPSAAGRRPTASGSAGAPPQAEQD